MTTSPEKRPYDKVREVLESIGGKMSYRPGGGPGGVWELELWGKTTEVPVRDNIVNRLDLLYIAKVSNPKTWADYDSAAELVKDVRWKIVALFSE
jgi:hypothetical protein